MEVRIVLAIISIVFSSISLFFSIKSMTLFRTFNQNPSSIKESPPDEFQIKVLEYCLNKGITNVQIAPTEGGLLSLYEYDNTTNKFSIISELIKPSDERSSEGTFSIMKDKIDEYVSSKEVLEKEMK
jgi:hypothetical protein